MIQDARGPDEWLLLSTCVARMSELDPVYRSYPGCARRDLQNAILAGRIVLRGYRPGLNDPTPDVFDEEITHRHHIDLIHNTLSERRPGPSDTRVCLLSDVKIEWNQTKAYLLAHAVERKVTNPNVNTRPLIPKRAKTLTNDYIEQEKKADRQPTLQGLEKFARDKGFTGGRDHLRAEFHRYRNAAGIPVRRGRIKKSPP